MKSIILALLVIAGAVGVIDAVCENKRTRKYCERMKKRGDCKRHASFMKTNCAKSCGMCNKGPPPGRIPGMRIAKTPSVQDPKIKSKLENCEAVFVCTFNYASRYAVEWYKGSDLILRRTDVTGKNQKLRYADYKSHSLNRTQVYCKVGIGAGVRVTANRISNKIPILLRAYLVSPAAKQVTINEGDETDIKVKIRGYASWWCAGGNSKNHNDCKMVINPQQNDIGNTPKCFWPNRNISQTIGVWSGPKGVRPVCGSYLECDTPIHQPSVFTVKIKGRIDGILEEPKPNRVLVTIKMCKVLDNKDCSKRMPKNNAEKECVDTNIVVKVNVKDNDVKRICKSYTDPHIMTFDQKRYDVMQSGEFVLYRNTLLPYAVHARFKKGKWCAWWGGTCNCGVYVKACNDVILIDRCSSMYKIQIYKKGEFTPGFRIIEAKKGLQYNIILPSGTLIKVLINCRRPQYIDIHIYSSAADVGKTTGLCGNNDNNRLNDCDGRNNCNNKYFETQKVPPGSKQSLINGALNSKDCKMKKTFCNCRPGCKHLFECDAKDVETCDSLSDKDITEQIIHKTKESRASTKSICSPINRSGRRKRSLPTAKPFLPPKMVKWNSRQQEDAQNFCMKFLTGSRATKSCIDTLKVKGVATTVNLDAEVKDCITDIKLSGDRTWAASQRESLKAQCVREFSTDTNLLPKDKNGNPDYSATPAVLDLACVYDCSGNGICKKGECICNSGFEGAGCETDKDECATSPCKNGATCKDKLNDYECQCVAGWEGKKCEQDKDECTPSPCKNGATCKDKLNNYECQCVAGWKGKNCDQDIDECATSPCKNGAACKDKLNDYECRCGPGWKGKNCDQARTDPSKIIRLVNGGSNDGRVEVLHKGEWGTVCDDCWIKDRHCGPDHGRHNANVICRMLGFRSGVAKIEAHYGWGSGKIWLDSVKCTGSETSIFDCPRLPFGENDCNHGEDVGVECS